MVAILATQALAKRFGGVVATDNVTLDIMSGELRCRIGPNGAGKSTLFALLCGIHRPDSGLVMLKGQVDPISDIRAGELAHNKLQWLEIAMVLAGGPDILLLDEPTAGLSPEQTLKTARVLRHLNESGLTIVVVEHDISFVREVARKVTVLHQGRIFAEGTIDQITGHDEVREIYLGRG